MSDVDQAGLLQVRAGGLAAALDSPQNPGGRTGHSREAFRFWGAATLEEISGGYLAAYRDYVLEGGGAVASQALAAVQAFLTWASGVSPSSHRTRSASS